MLCVTGSEKNLEDLSARLYAVPKKFLQEIRVDCLQETLGENLWNVIRPFKDRLVFTCRPVRQGGFFAEEESDRLHLLRRAVCEGVAYVDVEADVDDAMWRDLRSRQASSKLLASWHLYEPVSSFSDLHAAHARLCTCPADVYKFAVTVNDALELKSIRDLPWTGRERVIIGMGPAGLLSRCAWSLFGSLWTYVAVDASRETASGQLSLEHAQAWRLDVAADHRFFGVVGGAQVIHSLGARVYNRLFSARNLDATYIPVVSVRAPEIFDFLQELGFAGFAVTMPNKTLAAKYAVKDSVATETFSVNSIRFADGKPLGRNTDVAGVEVPLRRLFGEDVRNRSALILGSGGAARAAVVAACALGMEVSVAARRVRELRRDWKTTCLFRSIPWEERAVVEADVLINATPLREFSEGLWPCDQPVTSSVVFDLAIGAGESALLRDARVRGAQCLTPRDMWIAQGAAQMGWFLEQSLEGEELLSLLAELGENF